MNNTQKIKIAMGYGSGLSLITAGLKATLTNEALYSIVSSSAIALTASSLAIYFFLYCLDCDFSFILERE
ncbi:hypothetical protein [Vreelandella neptunia]|uniref:Uncharacterized protein n=1 Tax=Vreelandella neptunia TaxID=115551 RepID=A0ABS9S9T5_9GAMM|nr:hypothetical protein [Halomonas neptunia]MCH4812877.1 hypothetical protein [Halomonas neptunia]